LVIDGNYSAARNLVWMRADTVIWFDRDPPDRASYNAPHGHPGNAMERKS
jgi:hypothetical protein